MNYITPIEAAEKWNVTLRAVQYYCSNGRIVGAVRRGRQWFIPEDAARPADGRISTVRQSPDVEPYHFPLFVFTRYYFAASELSEDEHMLLEAQILNLKGRFSDSVHCCRMLINATSSVSVRFGAWFTNMFNFMLLGLASEMLACKNALDSICEGATEHQEDYRLLIAYWENSYLFSSSRYQAIDVSRLSPDAMLTYMLVSLLIATFSGNESSEGFIRVFEAICRETELLGIAPLQLFIHSLLAVLHSRRDNLEAKQRHINEACRIGFENGYVRFLAKCTSLDIESFVRCLSQYGEKFSSDIFERCARYRHNWQIIYTAISGPNPVTDINIFEHELVMLLMYNTSINDIAVLKNISETEVRQAIRELCERLSVKSKNELVELLRATYCPTEAAPSSVVPPPPKTQ